MKRLNAGHTLSQSVPSSRSVTDGGVCSAVARTRDVSCAEKIYATLRECREQTGVKKSRGVRMQGYLHKKSEKNKKWKSMYFMLQNENGEDRLFFYDNPKRTKPRGLIDLSCSYLYQVTIFFWLLTSPPLRFEYEQFFRKKNKALKVWKYDDTTRNDEARWYNPLD